MFFRPGDLSVRMFAPKTHTVTLIESGQLENLRRLYMKVATILFVLVIASTVYPQHFHNGSASTGEKPKVMLDAGVGNVDHTVSSKNEEAQKFFNQGLAYMYAFNHAEGINSFKHAAELDPNMAMAYWGIAFGLGSNYNVTADEAALAE